MRKLFAFIIMVLFVFTIVKTNSVTETFLDFDDIEYIEVVKV